MVLGGPLLLKPFLFLHFMHVMTGGAASDRPHHAMMNGMAGDPSDDGAGEAADRLGAVDRNKQSGSAERGSQETHRTILP